MRGLRPISGPYDPYAKNVTNITRNRISSKMDGRSSRWSHESERTDVNPLKVDDSKRSKVETFLDRSLIVEWHQSLMIRPSTIERPSTFIDLDRPKLKLMLFLVYF